MRPDMLNNMCDTMPYYLLFSMCDNTHFYTAINRAEGADCGKGGGAV